MSPGEMRALGLMKLLVMIAFATAIYPLVLDPLAKLVTRDERARAPRGGLPGLASDIYDTMRGDRSLGQTVGGVFTPALGSESAIEMLSNRDFYTGRHIYGNDKNLTGKSAQVLRWLGGKSLPGQIMGRIDRGAGLQALWSLMGFTFPLDHGMLAAARIRQDEAGAKPVDPKASKIFQSIMAAAEQSRRSNGKDRSLATALLHSGELSKAQRRELREALHMPAIVFATKGLESDEDVYRVFEAGTRDEKRDLLDDRATYRRLTRYARGLGHKEGREAEDRALAELRKH